MSHHRRSRLLWRAAAVVAFALGAVAWVPPAPARAATEEPKKDDDLARRAYDLLLGSDQKKPDAKAADDAKPAPKPTDDKKPDDAVPAPKPADDTPGAPWPDKNPDGSSAAPKPKPFVPPGGALPGAGGASLGGNDARPTPGRAPKPEPKPEDKPKAPPTGADYTIKEGDTFSSIAIALYGDEKKWAAIAQANPLVDPTKLKVGQKIRLPDLAKAEQERAEQFEKIAKDVAAPNATPATVTVQPGDTLSHIAQRVYGKARLWKIIFEANKDQLSDPGDVKVGQKLKIPPKPADEPAKTDKKSG